MFHNLFYDFTPRDWNRYGGFFALNVAIVLYATGCILGVMGRFIENGMVTFFLPIVFISTLSFAALYPVLRRISPGLPRFGALYVAFLIALVLLSITSAILSAVLSGQSRADFPMMLGALRNYGQFMLLVLGIGHMYGFPALLIIATVNKLLSPVFFPRMAEND